MELKINSFGKTLPLEIVNHILSYRPRHPIFTLKDYEFGLYYIQWLKNEIKDKHRAIRENDYHDDFDFCLDTIMRYEIELRKPHKVIFGCADFYKSDRKRVI